MKQISFTISEIMMLLKLVDKESTDKKSTRDRETLNDLCDKIHSGRFVFEEEVKE